MRLLTSRAIPLLLSTMLLAGCSPLSAFRVPTAAVAPALSRSASPQAPTPAVTVPVVPGPVAPVPVTSGPVASAPVTPAGTQPGRPVPGSAAPTVAPTSPTMHPAPVPPPSSKPAPDLEPLGAALAAHLADQSGTWGIYVLDIESGRGIGINADQPFPTASTFKLPMALYILDQVEQGKASLTELLTYRAARDYEEGTGSLQDTLEEGDLLPVKRLLELAITQSDNIATNMLLNRFGTVNIHAFMRQMGGKVTRFDDLRNGTTPQEMARYMQLAANGQVISNPTLRQLLVDWLSSTVFSDRIAAGTPQGVRVAHKIGTLEGVVNDVGLVYGPKRSFVVSVYSMDVDEDVASDVIAELTARVYRFEQSLATP